MSATLFFHMLAGLVSVSAGLAALALTKGSGPHKRMGRIFAVGMVAMCLSGAYMALFVHPDLLNAIAGVFTAYLVATGWRAVRHPVLRLRRTDLALAAVALVTGIGGITLSALRLDAGHGADAYSIGYAVFGSLALIAFAGDVSVLIRGKIMGKRRLARHLGRIGFALFVASFSLFLALPNRILPDFIRQTSLKWLPVAFVVGSLIYWAVHTLRGGDVRAQSPSAPQSGSYSSV